MSAKQGLRALAAAFERGINWFDLSPSYGDGLAENIFGKFVCNRRDRLHICTKCGILPPTVGSWVKIARPVARAAINRVPALRRWGAAGRPAARQMPLTGDFIRESLDASLRRLQTEYVDVLALHDPTGADLCNEDVAAALAAVLDSGKARAIGVAGSFDAAMVGVAAGLPLGHIQFADYPGRGSVGQARQVLGSRIDNTFVATHSVLSWRRKVNYRKVSPTIKLEALGALRDLGYTMELGASLDAAALDYALESNRLGTVVVSMFSPDHLKANLARLKAPPANVVEIGSLFQRFLVGANRGVGGE